jgi:zinc D-Ala-D-Ala carboxypeptidase
MSAARWGEYPSFTESEFACRHTGKNMMQHEFMIVLQAIRNEYGKPMRITSGYRDPKHPIEAAKGHANGEHTKGLCADIACASSAERFELVRIALKHGVTRIGIAKTFLHFGIGGEGLPNNVIWDYL